MDALDGEVLTQWSSAFMARATADPYNLPGTPQVEWWRAVRAEEILVVAGSDELFVDDVEAVGAKIKVIGPPLGVSWRCRNGTGPMPEAVKCACGHDGRDCPGRGARSGDVSYDVGI